MKALFITAGDISWGSSRIRAYWVAEHMNADVVMMDDLDKLVSAPDYDAYIFQKMGAPKAQKELRELGKPVWLDQCDPMWWFLPDDSQRMFAECDGVVVSSQGLGEDLRKWLRYQDLRVPTHLIHDRMSLDHYDRPKQSHDAHNPTRFLWYGASMNRVSIIAAWANLHRLVANGYNIELTVMDDRPEARFMPGDEVTIYQVPWVLEKEPDVIAAHDIVLLPPYPGPWGRVKSENKRRTAMACGMPYVSGTDYWELVDLIEHPERRARIGARGRKDAERLWDVKRSAAEWEGLLSAHV